MLVAILTTLIISPFVLRFWWIKVKALARSRNWPELEKFAKQKKSPIGYEPFVDACLEMSNRAEARKFVDRLPAESRVSYLVKLGYMLDGVAVH